jgi:D-alanyl-D-alanine carboxypeptidase/D-alanyl-D-alanine-endopeptidase (penicillin-binding protein 4)
MRTLVLFALIIAAAPLAAAQATRLPEPVAQALARSGIPEASVAAYVHEVGAERPLLTVGAERALNPASTIKLVTTYAALELLGPAYVWNTEAYAAGPLQGDTLNGDLIIKGYGDPRFSLEHFWLMLRDLRSRGVREVRGDLVLDRSYFAAADFDSARFDDQPTRPYNTGPDALLINYKAVRVRFVPDPDASAVRIAVEPPLPQLQVINNIVLDNGACGDWRARLKFDLQGGPTSARLALSGRYPSGCGENDRYFSVLSHQHYTLGLFKELWRELGGTFAGGVRNGQAEPNANPIVSARSPALAEIVRDINKFSNNVMARQLFLTLGAVGAGAPATPEKSSEVIRQWLMKKGLSFPELVLENGSGLSRIERISAKNFGQLLLNAFGSPVMPELIASLPLVAADGTMKKRLSGADVAGQAHVKTGTLNGVRAIAGYVLDARGRRVVVVLIVNHNNAANAQSAQDALLRWVYTRNGDNPGRARR